MGPSLINKEDFREESLCAVIITETYSSNFYPFTNDSSLALIPLVNTPLLDYSLDWLQRCEVEEVIIYCNIVGHLEEVKNHSRQWSRRYGNVMTLTVMSSENCTSLGDAMRDLYNKSLLKNDFILMTGPIVGNLDLPKMVKKFKALRKKDPNGVMSCVYVKNVSQGRYQDSSRIVNLIVNAKTGKILSHNRIDKPSSKITMQTDFFQSATKIKVLPRLEDPNLAICSPMIPPLFSDNFDYGSRDSLINGLIEQEELLGCSIYAHIAEEGYAACLTSFSSYEEISEAIIRRRIFPSIPERSLSSQRIRYLYQPFHGSYWDPSAKFHKKSLGDNVVIDAGTEIDSRCRMKNTVVGKHCVIKENVTINNSYLLGNVNVNKGCILDTCFIGDGTKLLPGVHLEPGVILGSGVILGPNLKVNRCNRLQAEPPSSSDESEANSSPLVCGKEGRAFVCEPPGDDADEGCLETRWGEELDGKDLCEESSDWSDGNEGIDDDSDDDDDEENDSAAEGEEEVFSDEEREQEFEREVKDSLMNAYKLKSDLKNVILEVNSSRHAYNISMDNVLATVTTATLFVVEECNETKLNGEKLWKSIKEGLQCFGGLIKNYIKKVKDQMTILKALEELANEQERLIPALQHILYEMNQELEILDDEVIIYWYSKKGHQTKAFPLIAKSISKYILWLQQNDKDDETESEED